jgi:hypothetical protein
VLREEEHWWHNPLVLSEFFKIHKEIGDKQACKRLQEDLSEIHAASHVAVWWWPNQVVPCHWADVVATRQYCGMSMRFGP